MARMNSNMDIFVFLVGTKYSSNIGSSARAMANFGAQKLFLIAPKAQVDAESYRSAAGAQNALDQCEKFSSWNDYFNLYEKPYLIGFSARQSKTTPRQLFTETINNFENNLPNKIGLVFGSEDNGLGRNDIALLNEVCQLPLSGEFKSLNLSQAVLLALHILNQSDLENQESKEPLGIDESLLKKWLLQLGFSLDAPHKNAFLTLRKLFLRSRPSLEEKLLIEKILNQTLRKLL